MQISITTYISVKIESMLNKGMVLYVKSSVDKPFMFIHESNVIHFICELSKLKKYKYTDSMLNEDYCFS